MAEAAETAKAEAAAEEAATGVGGKGAPLLERMRTYTAINSSAYNDNTNTAKKEERKYTG